MTGRLAGIGPLVRLILRRDRWLLPLWTVLLGLYPLLMVLAQESVNPTAASRLGYVDAIEGNSGFLVLYGPRLPRTPVRSASGRPVTPCGSSGWRVC